MVETKFNTLRIEVQKHILQFLTGQDIKSSRLVCTQWYRMLSTIRPPGFDLIGNNSEKLQILKQSFHPYIDVLNVINYTDILPICTSKLVGIPKSKNVYLYAGNSEENMLKLLRYYAKGSYSLILFRDSLAKVEPFRLKGLSYEFLHYLGIIAKIPSNDLRDMDERDHLIAIIQLMESTNLPNLEKFELRCFGRFPNENPLIQKFIQTLNTVIFVPLSVVVKSLGHSSNLQHLEIQFGNHEVPLQAVEINDIRESFKQIKKLNFLACFDVYISFQTSVFVIKFIRLMLKENGKSIKKFRLRSLDARTDWIPVDCEIQFKEVKLNFEEFREDTLLITPNVYRKLKSVTKLYLSIHTCTFLNWMNQIYPWIIATFPNLKKLSLNIPINLTRENFVIIFTNLDSLKEMLFNSRWKVVRVFCDE